MADRRPSMVPETTVPRLPLYLRSLLRLADSHETTVSSERLAGLAGVNAATVRKDLSYLGAEGTRGVGYDVAHLVAMTGQQLRVSQETAIVIVGAGHLARALANYRGFTGEGFRVIGLFDVARGKVGRRFAGMVVRHVAELGAVGRDGPRRRRGDHHTRVRGTGCGRSLGGSRGGSHLELRANLTACARGRVAS